MKNYYYKSRLLFRDIYNSKHSKNGMVIFIGNVVNMVIQMFVVMISARVLKPESYGIVTLVTSSVLLIIEIFSFRTWEALLKFGSEKLYRSKKEFINVFGGLIILDACCAICAFTLIQLLSKNLASSFLHNEEFAFLLKMYSLILIVDIPKTLLGAVLRLFKEFKRLVLTNITNSSIMFLMVISSLIIWGTVESVLIAYIVAELFSIIIMINIVKISFVKEQIEIKGFKFKGALTELRHMFSFLKSTYWTGTLKSFSNRFDVNLIGYLSSPYDVAIYKVSRKFVSLFNTTVVDPFYQLVYPEFVHALSNNNIERVKKIINKSLLIGAMLSFFVILLIIIFGDLFVLVFAGKDYMEATPLIKLAAFECGISILTFWLNPIVTSTGFPKFNTIAYLGRSITTLLLIFVLVPKMNNFGAGIATLAGFIVYVIILVFYFNIKIIKSLK